MGTTQNRISSPEATGGAGSSFEQKVGAYWLVQLLVGCIPPIFVDCIVQRVAFQTEHLGWSTDDLLITCADGAGQPKRLAAQVKRTFTVSPPTKNAKRRFSISGRTSITHVLRLDLTTDAGQAEAAMKSLLAFTASGQDGIGAADATWNARCTGPFAIRSATPAWDRWRQRAVQAQTPP